MQDTRPQGIGQHQERMLTNEERIALMKEEWSEEDLDHVRDALVDIIARGALSAPGLAHVYNKIAAWTNSPGLTEAEDVVDGEED